jgi:CheY-like chemotaxis protein
MISEIVAESILAHRGETCEHSDAMAPAAARRMKALVVDDYLIERRMVGRMIQKSAGLEVIEAADGQEALEMIGQEEPVVVLTDMQMPRMTGLELVAEVRNRYPHIPVILITAFGSEDLAIQALRAGATNYVSKRALATELAATIGQVLKVSATQRTRQRVIESLEGREARFRLENDPELLGPLINLLLEDLCAVDVCDSTARMQVGVALQEALANALYHGNLEVSSDLRQEDERNFYGMAERRRAEEPYRDRRIELVARVTRGAATYVISDEGPGFDTTRLDRPIDPEDLLRIGGRGLLLIRAFMDQVLYNEIGNRITLVKRGRTRG